MTKSKKRVLFTCNPYWIGGPITWLRRVAVYLPEQNWECELVLPGTTRESRGQWSDWPGTLRILDPEYSGHTLVRSLANATVRFNPDVVVGVALDAAPNAIRMLRQSKRTSVRYMDTLHNDNEIECERLRPHADVIDAVGVCSEECGGRVKRQTPELANRVTRFWYPAACDDHLEPDRFSSGPLRLILMARLYQYPKRVLDLVPLCKGLLEKNVDFRLTVIGDGPERTVLETGIRKLPGIGNRVEFLGWLPNSDALDVLRRQHVLLLLSEFEGQPIVILEGMGCGVVPVVTDITAHKEIIVPGKDGFLVPLGNIEKFVAALQRLALNRSQLAEIAAAVWHKASAIWRPSVAIGRLANLLDEVSQRQPLREDRIASISYPPSRMTQLGIPYAVQGIKRRLMRQPVVF